LEIETEAETMIQIQNKEQFTTAAARLQKERMKVRRAEAHKWEVTNTAEGRHLSRPVHPQRLGPLRIV
jgi:hypothetical protein